MRPLRILLLAPDSNPESISTSLVGYAHGEALARLHAVTLVTREANQDAVRRSSSAFQTIEPISTPRLDRFYAWCLRRVFKYDYGSHALTAFNYPFSLAFEWAAWKRLRHRIRAGEFDVALRLLPVTSVLPSPFAFFLRRGPIPFVIGPVNGGLPWPKGFTQAEKQKEWITGLRNAYRLLPFARSTYRNATAIIAGSSHTCGEFSAYHDKVFFVPENGIAQDLYSDVARPRRGDDMLELIFVGRLVPYKGCDLALRAAAELLKAGRAHFTVVGDGPERAALEELARSLEVSSRISFCGMLPHAETLQRLGLADVLVFPSIREFGGGVVFEALAKGVVPIVVDFGGPGDIVTPEVGYKVTLTSERHVVSQIARALQELSDSPERLHTASAQGLRYARAHLSWDSKAHTVSRILDWATGRGPKPDLRPPGEMQPVHGVHSS